MIGQAAVEKTILIDHVANWWIRTSLIRVVCIIRLADKEHWSVDLMHKRMKEWLFLNALYAGDESVIG